MVEHSKSLKDNFFNFAGWLEKLLIVTVIIGTLLNSQNFQGGRELLLSSLIGLAIVFVITAYKPRELFSSQEEADKYGDFKFSDFLGLIIVPRVLWLASGISVFGIFAYIVDFGNDGYIKIVGIGGFTILIATVLLFGTFITGTKKLNTVLPTLARSIPLAMIDSYILFFA